VGDDQPADDAVRTGGNGARFGAALAGSAFGSDAFAGGGCGPFGGFAVRAAGVCGRPKKVFVVALLCVFGREYSQLLLGRKRDDRQRFDLVLDGVLIVDLPL